MRNWFLCKVKYQKEDPQGKAKLVTEPYLVDALSFTEAETRIYEYLGQSIQGEFFVTHITKSKITDVFPYDDIDIWHKCKVTYYITDDESGKEKQVNNQMLVTAHNVKEAFDRIQEAMSGMLVTYRVPEVVESPIIEVLFHEQEEEEEVRDDMGKVEEEVDNQEES